MAGRWWQEEMNGEGEMNGEIWEFSPAVNIGLVDGIAAYTPYYIDNDHAEMKHFGRTTRRYHNQWWISKSLKSNHWVISACYCSNTRTKPNTSAVGASHPMISKETGWFSNELDFYDVLNDQTSHNGSQLVHLLILWCEIRDHPHMWMISDEMLWWYMEATMYSMAIAVSILIPLSSSSTAFYPGRLHIILLAEKPKMKGQVWFFASLGFSFLFPSCEHISL